MELYSAYLDYLKHFAAMLPEKFPDIFRLQFQLRIKKIQFEKAIKEGKEFSEAKVIFSEIKELEKQMYQWKRVNIDYTN